MGTPSWLEWKGLTGTPASRLLIFRAYPDFLAAYIGDIPGYLRSGAFHACKW